MRILDKYLVREFALPAVYCFDAFALLWIVMDLFESLADFVKAHARVWQVLHYYIVVFPDAFVLIMPISLLLGLLFCLSNLGRHNELIAMRASGVSLLRLAVPLLGIGLVASLLVFAVNELFVPRSKERGAMVMSALRMKGKKDVLENFFFTNAAARRDWYARQFNRRTFEMGNPEIHVRNPDGSLQMDAYAERAVWANGTWRFFGVDVHEYINGVPVLTRVAETNFTGVSEPPRRLIAEARRPEEMSSRELRRYVRALKSSGRTSRLGESYVALHYRYAFPFTSLMIVWIGIPLGMRVGRSGPLRSVGAALALVVVFYFLTEVTLGFGRAGHLPPLVAAWLTNFIFGVVGAVMLLRIR